MSELRAISSQLNSATNAIVQELSFNPAPPDPNLSLIDGHDLYQKFGKWKEATSTLPSGRHLGLYQAICKAPNPDFSSETPDDHTVTSENTDTQIDHGGIFFHVLAELTNICVRTGYVLQRWKKVVSVMLEKIPGQPKIDKLRVIHLFEADLNAWTGIIFGRHMMRKAKLAQTLGDEQGGSRKGRSATDIYVMKFLSFQMTDITKTPLAVMDNDAKACYDRIVMDLACLRCKHIGISHDACTLFKSFLHQAQYHISTSLGVSEQNYSARDDWHLHGPGQGNQSSPAIWAVISTMIINTMRKHSQGTTYSDPKQSREINHHMQVFVYDSSIRLNDFAHSLQGTTDVESMIHALQTTTQTWEQLLTATGGKLELSKCFYYFIQWGFNKEGAGKVDDLDTPTISLQQCTDSTSETIPRKSNYEVHRTLGFQAQPVNNYKAQHRILMDKSQSTLRALLAHQLDPNTALRAYCSVFLPSVSYPLTMGGMTQAQLKQVQSGPLNYTLQKL